MCYLWLLTLIALMAINVVPSTSNNSEVRDYNPKIIKSPWDEYPCSEPQLRGYILPDLLKSVYLKEEEVVYMPVYIVLRRCDMHSGCCGTIRKICAPVKSEIYYEKLHIEIDSLGPNGKRREWIQFEQHGKCACTNVTKRLQLERQYPKIKKFLPTRESSSN